MASIVDAFRESYEDENSIIKFILYSIPLYFCVDMLMKGNTTGYNILMPLVSVLLFGFLLKCTYNVRTGQDKVLPSFNFLGVFWTGLKGIIALAPLLFISYGLTIGFCALLAKYIPDEGLYKILAWIIGLVCTSIPYTGYMIYAKRFKISDAYNFKLISDTCSDVLFALIFMIPKLLLVNLIVFVPATYVFWLFFGIPHPIATYYWCLATIFVIAVTGHYLAQVAYEAIPSNDDEKDLL